MENDKNSMRIVNQERKVITMLFYNERSFFS